MLRENDTRSKFLCPYTDVERLLGTKLIHFPVLRGRFQATVAETQQACKA